jgi:tRNA dimethylallyltransferase
VTAFQGPTIVLTGPTASGKTDVADAIAQRFPVEIVSVDSALVYRGMDIGTAKPDAAMRTRWPHHLIDIVDPVDAWSAARFVTAASATIAAIRTRGRIPLLVGGTMLYLKALREGLSTLPPADPDVRAAIDADAARAGWPALHARLARVDAPTAARLAPGDAQRIQRALEVFELTGQPMSTLLAIAPPEASRDSGLGRHRVVALEPSDRAVLHARIATRFDTMLDTGLLDEVLTLRTRWPALTAAHPSMRAVGYRQAWAAVDGDHDRATLRASGIAATRQLAKRQLTWLRSMPVDMRLDCLRPDLTDAAIDAVAAGLARAG